MTEQLLRFKFDQRYLLIDLETESLNLCENNRPWQVGAMLCKGKRVEKEFQSDIWWDDLNVSPDAAMITRFDYGIYKERAKDPKETYEKIAKYLYDPSVIVVGQNIFGFDQYVLNIWRRGIGLKPDWSFAERMLDTRALFMQIQKENKTFDWSDPYSHQMKYINHRERGLKASLAFMMKHYGLDYDPKVHHEALPDCRYTWEVFQKIIWEVDI